MNSVGVFVLLLATSTLGAEFFSEDDLHASTLIREGMERAGISSKIMEAEIIKKIDEFLLSIPTFTEYSNLTISVLNDTIRVNGDLENTTINGLENHVIDRCKLSIIPISFAVHIGVPSVNTSGYYDVDGLFGKIVPIYGKGKQSISVSDLSFFIKVDISSVNGQLIIKNIDFELSIADVSLNLENFLGGDLGKVVTEIIEENFSEYLARIVYWYGDEITDTITVAGNKFLEGKTIDDILNWLQGKTTTESPPTSEIPFY